MTNETNIVVVLSFFEHPLWYWRRTTFEAHYLRWNKPVLVLGYSEKEDWDGLKESWAEESWVTKMFGRENIGEGRFFFLFSLVF